MSGYSWRSMSTSVDFPQPEGADRTMNKGFVFMTEDYSIFHLALERGVLGQHDRCAVLTDLGI